MVSSNVKELLPLECPARMRASVSSHSSGSGEPAAPRRQSQLRSQARSALLPAATPRCVVVRQLVCLPDASLRLSPRATGNERPSLTPRHRAAHAARVTPSLTPVPRVARVPVPSLTTSLTPVLERCAVAHASALHCAVAHASAPALRRRSRGASRYAVAHARALALHSWSAAGSHREMEPLQPASAYLRRWPPHWREPQLTRGSAQVTRPTPDHAARAAPLIVVRAGRRRTARSRSGGSPREGARSELASAVATGGGGPQAPPTRISAS